MHGSWNRLVAGVALSSSLSAGIPHPGLAQTEQIDRPGATRPLIPQPAPLSPAPFALPRVSPAEAPDAKLSQQVRVFLRVVRIAGNTVLTEAEIRDLVREYENRVVSAEELQELRRRLTLAYVNRGYLNSGATLPDQEIRDGMVEYRIVEGRLTGVEVSGNKHLKSDYVVARVLRGAGDPLNMNGLQQQLQLLQQSGLLDRINAELVPGSSPGEAMLRVAVEESRPYQFTASFGNNRSPSVGSNRGELAFQHRNLLGRGDALAVKVGTIADSGRDDFALDYALPLNSRDTSIFVRSTRSEALVVERPFDLLEIENRARTTAVGVTHPVVQTPDANLSLSLAFDSRSSQAYLLGQPFSFSPGIPEGYGKENTWRFSQDWLSRRPNEVIAFRSTFSFGKTNSTEKIGGIGPDVSYRSWLGQFQWARRYGEGSQLLFRADLQYTPNSLITLEKLSLGGSTSVRGFRESQFLRDKGYVTSLEYRVPVLRADSEEIKLQLATFVDHASAWNTDQTSATPRSISSLGLGAIWTPNAQIQAQLYAAAASRRLPQSNKTLQDRGIHFLAVYQFH